MTFEGEVVARAAETPRQAVITQLQYLSGHLSTDGDAGAQIRQVAVVDARETASGETKTIRYKAALPVAWPKDSQAPQSYELVLPRDASALPRFNATYDGKCGQSVYGQDRFWYDYNPRAPGCTFADGDVMRATATLRPHPRTTQDRYPEYDKVWADDKLEIVMVNGVIASDNPSDESYREVDAILSALGSKLENAQRTEAPQTRSVRRDQTLTGKVQIGGRLRDVVVRAINVYEVETSLDDFDAVYGPASADADIIVYSGHSGLGRHIKSLLARTKVKPEQYQVMYLYGCNTFEYVGTEIFREKSAKNGEARDPDGTKFLDVVSTARPAYGDNGRSTLALLDAMFDAKRSYNEILSSAFSSMHLTVVFGEEDNAFQP